MTGNKRTIEMLPASFAALALIGCASQTETLAQQGYPAPYAHRFDDGCHSGKRAGGALFEKVRKDVRRFDVDRECAQGRTAVPNVRGLGRRTGPDNPYRS